MIDVMIHKLSGYRGMQKYEQDNPSHFKMLGGIGD